MLILCWCNTLEAHDNEDAARISAELINTANSLGAAMTATNVDVASVLQPLLEKEPEIHALFKNITAKAM